MILIRAIFDVLEKDAFAPYGKQSSDEVCSLGTRASAQA